MSEQSNPKKSKNIFSSHFTFTILSKLFQGYRPSQIATQLGVTAQDIYYQTERMVEADLIHKDTSNGIKWTLTDKGIFILKQKLTGSVNSFNNYQTKPVSRTIPIRLDNLSFSFKVFNSISEDSHLKWTEINNGVSKCSLKYDTHTIELVKSENGSVILVHLEKKYCFDWTAQYIDEYNLAIHFAKQAAIKFGFQVSDVGKAAKRPHIAFEQDLITSFLAASYTAEIKTREGNDDYTAWIDSSNGVGELETNDHEYAYDYLMMPRTIKKIADTITIIREQTVGYEKHHHPILTMNN
jgi:hypothetical protein